MPTTTAPIAAVADPRQRRRLRERYLLAAVPTGLTFAAIATAIRRRGLCDRYGPGHAEWEYWAISRKYSRPSPSWSWPLGDAAGPTYLLTAVLGQAVRDVERAMPCTLALYHRDLAWPWLADCHCSPQHHACAPGALAFLHSPAAGTLYQFLAINRGAAMLHAQTLEQALRADHPWLTLELPPRGYTP